MIKDNCTMKKRSVNAIIIVLLCIIMTTACGQKSVAEENMDLLFGEWKCEDHPLENETYYTGFIAMHINEDGSFRMSDVEAGNPVISGTMELLSEKDMILKCTTEDDFDPPPTWQSMHEEQEITYSLSEDGKLHLTFNEKDAASTLVFVKQ